jgi:hypothetical protein
MAQVTVKAKILALVAAAATQNLDFLIFIIFMVFAEMFKI